MISPIKSLRRLKRGLRWFTFTHETPEIGKPTPDLDIYARIVERIRADSDVLICITTGGGSGQSVEERTAILPRFKPELASFKMGSVNFGLHPLLSKYENFQYEWEPEWLEFPRSWVFTNTFKDLEGICRLLKESGTKPELEIYDVGHLYNLKYLLDKELLRPPVYLQFVTGILGGIAAARSIFHISLPIALDNMEAKPFGRYPICCGQLFHRQPAID